MLQRFIVLFLVGLSFLFVQVIESDAAKKKKKTRNSPPWSSFSTNLNKQNPLVGKIWDVEEKIFLTPFELAGRLAAFDYILMGEIHDNPDHHRLQAWLIKNIAYLDRHPAVVMEMINLSQAPMVDDFHAARKRAWREGYQKAKKQGRLKKWRKEQGTRRKFGPTKQAEEFGPAIGWQGSGWPSWSYYQPNALAAFARHLKIKAGNADRADTRIISRNGFTTLGGPRQKNLGLDKSLEKSLQSALMDEIKTSHCNLMPARALVPMVNVQRYRDAVMAQQLRKVGLTSGAVLIAGNGHVRNDRGVPWYLNTRDPDATHASLMIIEVDAQTSAPDGLIPRDGEGKPVADFVWYTPGKKRPDPCKGMAKHFKKPGIKKTDTKKQASAAEIPATTKRKN